MDDYACLIKSKGYCYGGRSVGSSECVPVRSGGVCFGLDSADEVSGCSGQHLFAIVLL